MKNAIQNIIYYDCDTNISTKETRTLSVLDEEKEQIKKESNVVGLYPDFPFQIMEGWGCALTESSCYLLSQMEPQVRRKALKCWFGKDGMNARFIRLHIDSCDYSLSEYQAVADPIADPELKTFTIDRDRKYIIPILREAMALSDQKISILLSPWSPPAAWKTAPEITQNDAAVYGSLGQEFDLTRPSRCFGGRLKPEYYASWAKYLVKYIQAYLDEGLPVTMLSVQNEASAATNWDSCLWSSEQERDFLINHLYPEMENAGLADKIGLYIWDHNKERMVEHVAQMMDEDLADKIEGFAYHWYSGDHFDALRMLKERYPDKILMHSESCGLHIPGKTLPFDLPKDQKINAPKELSALLDENPYAVDFADAVSYAHDIIGDLNAGMDRWIDWNMIVDRTGGPRHVPGGFAAPLVYEEDRSFTRTVSYEYLLLIASALKGGMRRIGISIYDRTVEAAAAAGEDGSIAVVLLNQEDFDLTVYLRMKGTITEAVLPAHTISSVIYSTSE